jgi:hypothetical protein
MSALGRFIVDAVVLERRSPTVLARDHGISRRWIHKLVKRFKEVGYPALASRSRRPDSCSHQTAFLTSRPKSCGCDRSSLPPDTMLGQKPSPITSSAGSKACPRSRLAVPV